MKLDVYVYGMSVLSTLHRLASAWPDADGYAEIAETRVCPGGEAMNAALVLSSLGLRVALSGPHFGLETRSVLGRYVSQHDIDVRGVVTDEGYPGVRDVVVVSGARRTVLGSFERFFSERPERWSEADPTMIAQASVVAIDPFFGASSDRAAAAATRANKPYVTIDCPYDGALHGNAAVTVVSREFRRRSYGELDDRDLLARYTAHASGLTIFTAGSDAIRYARSGGDVESFPPYRVPVRSTLGAGDTFRAGVVYGVFRAFSDHACVRFAAGLSALLCTRFPIADNLPNLAEVEAFLQSAAAESGR